MIEIGPHSFPTQKAAQSHFQALFARYRPGDRVLGTDHDDLMDLTALPWYPKFSASQPKVVIFMVKALEPVIRAHLCFHDLLDHCGGRHIPREEIHHQAH